MNQKLIDTYEERKAAFEEYSGKTNRNTKRMMLDYNRYHEAYLITDRLMASGIHPERLNVLDFGCGVADYGIFFGRMGSLVAITDIDKQTLAFAKWRFAREDIDLFNLKHNFDLVIFGEVLDHLKNPLSIVQKYLDYGATYIFTSSYPYRSNDPTESHWQHDHHPKSALEQQPAVRELLETNFNKVNFGGQKNLWTRK